jgi:hypothetical protein
MKPFIHRLGTFALGASLLWPVTCAAQTNANAQAGPPAVAKEEAQPAAVAPELSTVNTVRQRQGQVIVLTRPQASIGLEPSLNTRPTRPERPALDPQVQQKVETLRKVADQYLNQQEEILKREKGTTDRDRELMRERLQELRRQWLEQTRANQKELRERLKELQDRLPSHREVLENARERTREAIRDRRDRRGLDN